MTYTYKLRGLDVAINFSEETRKRLLTFLKEYVVFADGAYDGQGNLTNKAINQAIQTLINKNVFEKEELTSTILLEIDVLIPVNIIDEITGK